MNSRFRPPLPVRVRLLVSPLLCLILLLSILVASVPAVRAATTAVPPTFVNALYYGDAGNQWGPNLHIVDSVAYVAAVDGAYGILLAANLPATAWSWNAYLPYASVASDVDSLGAAIFTAGSFRPPTCGASDGVGGTESKPGISRFEQQQFAWCQPQNFFPYRGVEGYFSLVHDGAGTALYAAGGGELTGFGGSRTLLAKFDPAGNLVWKRWYGSGYSGGSQTNAQVWAGGSLYLAGFNNDASAMLLKVDAAAVPPDANPAAEPAPVLAPVWAQHYSPGMRTVLYGITTDGTYLYAVGYQNAPNQDVLILKYDPDGNLLWHSEWDGGGADSAMGVAYANGLLYVTGETTSDGAGGKDVLLLTVDAASGAVQSSQTWGGTADDTGTAVALDGDALYVVGTTASYGNGSNDIALLRYELNLEQQPHAVAGGPYSADEGNSVVLDGSASSDPDGSLVAFEWDLDYDGVTFDADLTGAQPTSPAFADNFPSRTVALRVTDDDGLTAIATTTLDVANVPPTVEAGPDQAAVAGSLVSLAPATFSDPGTLDTHTATVTWGDGTSDPGTVSESNGAGTVTASHMYANSGAHTVEVCVADDDGGQACDSLDVTVTPANQPPACGTAVPSVSTLWPADHRIVAVAIQGVSDPDGDVVTVAIASIYQDEPVDSTGDGRFTPDGGGLGSATAKLRAERQGSGNGRVYHVAFSADDGRGGRCTGAVVVGVPKSQGDPGDPGDDGALYDATVGTPAAQAAFAAGLSEAPPEGFQPLFLPMIAR